MLVGHYGTMWLVYRTTDFGLGIPRQANAAIFVVLLSAAGSAIVDTGNPLYGLALFSGCLGLFWWLGGYTRRDIEFVIDKTLRRK